MSYGQMKKSDRKSVQDIGLRQPSFMGFRDCRLPGFKQTPQRLRSGSYDPFRPFIGFRAFARLETPQRLRSGSQEPFGPQPSVLTGFRQPSNPAKAVQRLLQATWATPIWFYGLSRLPGSQEPFRPQPSCFTRFQDCRLPALKPAKAAQQLPKALWATAI